MAVDEGGECVLGVVAAALEEPLEQQAVGQAAGRAGAKEGLDSLDEFHRGPPFQRITRRLPTGRSLYSVVCARRTGIPVLSGFHAHGQVHPILVQRM